MKNLSTLKVGKIVLGKRADYCNGKGEKFKKFLVVMIGPSWVKLKRGKEIMTVGFEGRQNTHPFSTDWIFVKETK